MQYSDTDWINAAINSLKKAKICMEKGSNEVVKQHVAAAQRYLREVK